MARRKPLVCQYLENISRAALEEYQDIVREFVRGRPGVYALYRRNRLYYVGLARNLRNRLNQHLKGRHGQSWDRFSVYLTIGDDHMRELESLIVRIVRPRGNKQIGKFAKAENLQRSLKRRFRIEQQRWLTEMFGPARKPEPEDDWPPRRKHGDEPEAALMRYIRNGSLEKRGLRASFKGKRYRAHVRKDGRIRYGQRLFDSPSDAARTAAKRRSMNGWWFWMYERGPNNWVRLRELRR